MQDEKLKIGVVTYWTSKDNYGQLLQAYALQKVLRNAGYDAFLIRYDVTTNSFHVKQRRLRWLKIFNPLAIAGYIKRKLYARPQCPEPSRNFDGFLKDHIVSTELLYSAKALQANPPTADVYICGSDQIWKKTYIGIDACHYLQFAPVGSHKIAYAVSFGGCSFSKREIRQISKFLHDFDFVSVREQGGVEICRRAGRNDVLCMPDPTILLPVSAYKQLTVVPDMEGNKYLLLYLLGHSTDLDIAEVYRFAREKNLEVVYVPSQGRIDSYPKTYPTIPQWLGLIAGAEYVITNSFHGTVFSIIFNKQFAVALLSGGTKTKVMNERIDTLLTMTELDGRTLKNNIYAIERPIDYESVNAVLQQQREWATGLLLQTVNKA